MRHLISKYVGITNGDIGAAYFSNALWFNIGDALCGVQTKVRMTFMYAGIKLVATATSPERIYNKTAPLLREKIQLHQQVKCL